MPQSLLTVSRFDCLDFPHYVERRVCERERTITIGGIMSCPSCRSSNQAEFPSEMLIHFTGLKNLDKPGVSVFQKLLICLDCGFLQSTVPASELAQLAAGALTNERLAGRRAFNDDAATAD